MLDLIRSAQGGSGLESLSKQFGLDRTKTEEVLSSVLPAVSAGFKHRAQDKGGLAGILQSIQGTDHEDIFDNSRTIDRGELRARGNDVLGQIFGSKDISRAVAQKTERSSGVGADTVKQMLPVIASMVLGGVQKKASSDSQLNGSVSGLLQGLLGSERPSRPSSGGGNLDDILGAVLGQKSRQPEPQPRSGGGLGGILGGLLRGRRTAPQRQPRARQRDSNLDDLLGGIFGTAPKARQTTGDPKLDSVIGMFDANGDGEVDLDVLRQLARRR